MRVKSTSNKISIDVVLDIEFGIEFYVNFKAQIPKFDIGFDIELIDELA